MKAFLDSLPVVEGDVLEVIATGVPAETPGQRTAGLEAAAPALPVASSDVRSDDADHENREAAAGGTTLRTMAGRFESAAGAAEDAGGSPGDGGGGGAFCCAPAPRGIDTEKQNFRQRGLCSAGGHSESRPGPGGELGTHDAATERGGADGGPPAASDLCKRTKKKQGGPTTAAKQRTRSSQKVRISQKKKGGSEC